METDYLQVVILLGDGHGDLFDSELDDVDDHDVEVGVTNGPQLLDNLSHILDEVSLWFRAGFGELGVVDLKSEASGSRGVVQAR